MDEIIVYIVFIAIASILSAVSNRNKKKEEEAQASQRRQQRQQREQKEAYTDTYRSSSSHTGGSACPKCSFVNPAGNTSCMFCGHELPAHRSTTSAAASPDKQLSSDEKLNRMETLVQQKERHQQKAQKDQEGTKEQKPERETQRQRPTDQIEKPLPPQRKKYTPDRQAGKALERGIFRDSRSKRKTVQKSSPEALKLYRMLKDRNSLHNAILVKEILDKPKALRRR